MTMTYGDDLDDDACTEVGMRTARARQSCMFVKNNTALVEKFARCFSQPEDIGQTM